MVEQDQAPLACRTRRFLGSHIHCKRLLSLLARIQLPGNDPAHFKAQINGKKKANADRMVFCRREVLDNAANERRYRTADNKVGYVSMYVD